MSAYTRELSLPARVCLPILFIALFASLSAQITLSTIRGSVRGPSGVPVASAAVIETDTAKIQSSVGSKRYQVTPMIGGWATINYMLASLPNLQSRISGLSLRWASQSSSQVLNGMDGVTTDGDVSQLILMADMEEVTVVTVNSTAEYRSVGFVNNTSKSGNNRLHGNGYYCHQNSALFARAYFAPQKARTSFTGSEWM